MAKKQLDQDRIQLEAVINGDQARKELATLKQGVQSLRTEQQSLRKEEEALTAQRKKAAASGNTDEVKRLKTAIGEIKTKYSELSTSIKTNEARQQELRTSLGLTGQSLRDLRQTAIGLRAAISAAIPQTPEWDALQEKAGLVAARIKEVGTEAGIQAANWEKQRQGLALTEMNAYQLGLEMKRLQAIINDPNASLADNQEAIAELALVKDRTEELTNATRIGAVEWEKQRQGMALVEMNAHQLGLEMARLQAIMDDPKSTPGDVQQAAKDMAAAKDRTEELTSATRIARDEWVAMRGSFTLDQMTGDQLKMEIAHLEELVAGMQAADPALASTGKRLDEAREHLRLLTTEAGRAEKEWLKLRESLSLGDMSGEQLKREQQYLESLIATMTEADVVASGTGKRLDEVKDRIRRMGTEAGRAEAEWERLRQGMKLEDMSIEQLKLEAAYLKKLKEQLPTTSAEFDRLEKELKQVEGALELATNETTRAAAQWEVMRKNVALTDMTMEQLEAESKRLKAALQGIHPDDAAFARTRGELDAVDNRMQRLRSGLGPFGRMWADVKTQVMGAGAVLGTLFAGGALIQGFRSLVTGGAALSDELVNIQRVTGKTANEVGKLNSEIGKIDTRTANNELRGIAVGLGQVGEDVSAAAVTAIDKINLALGDEFGGSAQEITTTISVLRNNLSDLKSGNYADDVGRIGNAILVLGQSGLATAPVVSDIATRVAGVARQFKISSGDILGTAASFQELGISTERGSTAYTKLLQKISTAPLAFAEVVKKAGGNVDDFLKLVDTDMQAAFLMVAKSAKAAGSENTAFGAILKELETSGAGVSELLSKVGANTDLFTQKAILATEALKNQNAINAQAKLANENLAAVLEKLGKEFNRIFTSRTVINGITEIVYALRDLVGWFKQNIDAIKFWGGVLVKATAVWAGFRVGALLATAASKLWEAALIKHTRVTELFAGKVGLASKAANLFSAAWKTNPLGLIISLATTAYTIFSSFGEEVDNAAASMRGFSEQEVESARNANALYLQIMKTKEGTAERAALIEKLKALYPEYLKNIDSETISNNQLKRSLELVNMQLIQKAKLEKVDATVAAERDKAADAGLKASAAEAKALTLLSDLSTKYGIDLQKATAGATSTWEQAVAVRQAIIDKNLKQGGNGLFKETFELSEAIGELGKYEGFAKKKNEVALKYAEVGEKEKQALTDKFNKEQNVRELQDVERESGELTRRYMATSSKEEEAKIEARLKVLRARKDELLAAIADPGRAGKMKPVDLTVETSGFDEATATVGELDSEIKRLKKSLDGVNDPAQAKAINDLIAHYKELRAGILGTSTASGKSKEELLKNLDDLERDLKQWREELRRDQLHADDKALADLDAKHEEELRKLKEQHAELKKAGKLPQAQEQSDLGLLKDTQAEARRALLSKQEAERAKAVAASNARINALVKEGETAHLAAEVEVWQKRLAKASEGTAEYQRILKGLNTAQQQLSDENERIALKAETEKWDKVILEAQMRLAEMGQDLMTGGMTGDVDPGLVQDYATLTDQVVELEKGKQERLTDLQRAGAADRKQSSDEEAKAERDIWVKRFQGAADLANGINDLIQGSIALKDVEIQIAEDNADRDGVRTQEEIDNINRLKAERRKAALTAIKVQMAAAIANGVAQAMSLPFPANLAAALTTIGTVMGLMAQAKALMNESSDTETASTQAAPALNNVPVGEKGIPALPGPSHAQGGLDVVDTTTGRRVANIEGKEAVVNKDVTAANPEVIDELMAAAHRPDKKVRLADGGLLGMEEDQPTRGRGPVRGTAVVNVVGPAGTEQAADQHGQRLADGGLMDLVEAQATGHGPVRGTAVVNAAAPTPSPTDAGIFGGSPHSQGGNSVFDNATGRQIAEVEEGEAWMVLSKRFTEMNRDTIGTILEASRKGLRLDFSAAPLPKPSPAAVSRAMNVVHMAQGGMVRGTAVVNASDPDAGGNGAGSNTGDARAADNTEMLALLRRMVELQEGTLAGVQNYPDKIEAFMVPSKANDRVVADWESQKAKRSVARRA